MNKQSWFVVMLMVNENMLKSLFLFRTGENKGFVKLMQDKKMKEKYDMAFADVIKLAFGDSLIGGINELYSVCSSKSDVDADVKALVDKLYELTGGA